MYEIEIEDALVKWIPSHYGNAFHVDVERQVQLANGGRADVVSTCWFRDPNENERQNLFVDIWEVKRDKVDLSSLLQVLTYSSSVEGAYSDYLTEQLRLHRTFNHRAFFRCHLVGLETDSKLIKNPALHEILTTWRYVVTNGEITFERTDPMWIEARSKPPTLRRMFSRFPMVEFTPFSAKEGA